MRRCQIVSPSAALALALAVSACGTDSSGPNPGGFDASTMLVEVPARVILATYVDLEAKATALNAAVVALNAAVTEPNLLAAKEAWRATRRPWEQSEGFLFGPVETQGIDPSIDSWPVNQADLDAVLASSATLTSAYIDGLEGTLKGFHTIEYLLFGTGSKTAAQLTTREREYLLAATQSLVNATTQLRQAWDPAGGDYGAVVATAGQAGNAVYTSESQAVQELINGMIGICDEVGNGKISDPFEQQDRSLEESQFSNNSNADFADNIRSVQNVYLGRYNSSTGTGIRALVLAKGSAALDTRIQGEIQAAIAAIGEMTPTFGEAITANPTKVEGARTAVGTLRQTLESEVLPLAQ